MLYSLIVFILTCLLLVIAILKKPNIKIGKFHIETFLIVSLVGALFIIIPGIIPFSYVLDNIFANSPINPIKILIILISMAMLSITLDEMGFFNYIAIKSINLVKGSQYKLFFILYILIAILTIFTSNDIVILTFTLFICYFAKEAKINPIPYLVMEFVTANTYSMLFIIGNPTNIYLATKSNISFFAYFQTMLIPTIMAGLTSLVILLLLFHKQLRQKFEDVKIQQIELHSKPITIITIIHLFLATILLAISSYINLDMWIIALFALLSLTTILIFYSVITKSNTVIKRVYLRLPYNLVIFVLSMFTLVLALKYHNVFTYIHRFLSSLATNKLNTILVYGLSSALCDNIINNIPMSLAYSSLLELVSSNLNPAIYATIISSNLGAYLTPIGALAGIMWMNILKNQNIKYSFMDFVKYGILITPLVLMSALLGLYLI